MWLIKNSNFGRSIQRDALELKLGQGRTCEKINFTYPQIFTTKQRTTVFCVAGIARSIPLTERVEAA